MEGKSNYSKALEIIKQTKETNSKDYVQPALVKEAWKNFNDGNEDLAYNIINEGFNVGLIAGYKYTEICENFGRTGEFMEIARKNPLMYLD